MLRYKQVVCLRTELIEHVRLKMLSRCNLGSMEGGGGSAGLFHTVLRVGAIPYYA